MITRQDQNPIHSFLPITLAPVLRDRESLIRHPGVIMFTDAFGIRPSSLAMGRRLASHGYVVLVPDVFYRAGAYEPLDPKAVFAGGDMATVLAPLLSSTDTRRATADSRAFLDYLGSRADVAETGIGVVGYCMGGRLALTVAGSYPDLVGAAALFHTSQVVDDTELSPARVVPDIRARVYVAGADRDAGYPPEQAAELHRMLTAAGVAHRLEIYLDALHGFTQPDFPVYDEAAAERHWTELLRLFDETLRPAA